MLIIHKNASQTIEKYILVHTIMCLHPLSCVKLDWLVEMCVVLVLSQSIVPSSFTTRNSSLCRRITHALLSKMRSIIVSRAWKLNYIIKQMKSNRTIYAYVNLCVYLWGDRKPMVPAKKDKDGGACLGNSDDICSNVPSPPIEITWPHKHTQIYTNDKYNDKYCIFCSHSSWIYNFLKTVLYC